MKKSKKALLRSISIILSIMMILSALPMTVYAEGSTGTKGVSTGAKGIGTTTFVSPAASLTASAWQLKVIGAGSINMEQVTDAQWNSTDNSGVQFYYSIMDSSGSVFSNNSFNGGTGLPSEFGTVSYCYVYYAEDPSTAGKELSNAVPVGMSQSQWLSTLANYEKDLSHMSDGCIDYTELLQTELTWVDSSDNTLPLAYSLGGEGSIVYEPHWYSVFVKLEQDGADPFINTDNSVVYVHDGSGSGTGGTGGGTVPSGFAGPAVSVRANPYANVNGTQTQVNDVEYESVSNSGVRFCYFVIDSNYAAFGSGTGQKALNAEDGSIEFAYVYSDTVPSGSTDITSLCPVGMTAQSWQNTVTEYRSQWTSDNPRTKVDYTNLLAALNWTSDDRLRVYSDNEVYGTSGGTAHYTNRFYGAFIRWSKDSDILYGTDCPLVYLHEKAPDVITSPVISAIAIPCNTNTNASVNGTQVIIPRTATETGIDFRYSITDNYNVTWSDADALNPKPVDTSAVRIEYLWTYTDYNNMANLPAGRVPIGMSSLDWNNMRNDYLTEWLSEHSSAEPDYSDLIIDLPGWTTDPVLPLFDDKTVYGAGNGEAGVYSPRFYSCMIRLTFLDGSGYRKAFINTGYSVQIKFGTVGAVNAPVTFNGMELRYYDTSKHIYDYVWQSMGYVSVESFTDYIVGYVLTDDFGQQYGNLDYGHPALPSNAHLEYLWNYISIEDYNGNSSTTAITNIFPGWNAIPCGMTKAAWQALTDGKSNEEKNAVLASLSGWTEDNRMPVYSKGERGYCSKPQHL